MIVILICWYGTIKFIDWCVTENILLKIKYLERIYEDELNEVPELNPFHYIKGADIYRYYYALNINPIWHLVGNGYITWRFYEQLKHNLEEYTKDDY